MALAWTNSQPLEGAIEIWNVWVHRGDERMNEYVELGLQLKAAWDREAAKESD